MTHHDSDEKDIHEDGCCCCGGEEEEEEDLDVVYLTDEDGVEAPWGLLNVIEDGGKSYALLAPLEQLTDDESDSIEVIILRYEKDEDGGESFSEVEDEAELTRIEELASQALEEEGFLKS